MSESLSSQQDPLVDLALYQSTLGAISTSASSVHTLLSSTSSSETEFPNGISLLSLKNSLLLSYMHNLTLLALCRVHGRSISCSSSSSSVIEKGGRNNSDSNGESKLVEEMVRQRIVLEKIRPMEMKLKYQVDKLVKKAESADRLEKEGGARAGAGGAGEDGEIGNDPLAFRPNPAALMSSANNGGDLSGSEEDNDFNDDDLAPQGTGRDRGSAAGRSSDGIYRPPRLAPVAYNEPGKGKKQRAPPQNAFLRDMATSLTSSTANPYVESSSGLGNTPSLQSRKAQKLADIQAYEEDNYTRVFMNKKDAKRRRLDEEDIALGGTGSREDYLKGSKGVRGQKAAGFENEFDDLLSSIGKKRKTGAADGYDALRAMRREKKPVSTGNGGENELVNTNGVPSSSSANGGGSGGGKKKKGRFETAVKRSVQAGKRGERK